MERATQEALKLGLLFRNEIPQGEELDVLCFQHLLLQEFAAAVFISRQDIVSEITDVSRLVIVTSFI